MGNSHGSVRYRVSVHGVKSLGGHFACLCGGLDFYEVFFLTVIFQKEKGNFYSEKSLKRANPLLQSAGINVQSPQNESTPRALTLVYSILLVY